MPKKAKVDKTFESIQKGAPFYPDHTCPKINAVIDQIEDLRSHNTDLRDGLQYWRNHFRELLKLLSPEQRKKYLKQWKDG